MTWKLAAEEHRQQAAIFQKLTGKLFQASKETHRTLVKIAQNIDDGSLIRDFLCPQKFSVTISEREC